MGCCTVLVPPSPKFQLQPLTVPVDVSLNATVIGALPDVVLTLKFATGGGIVAVIRLVRVWFPPGPLTVKVTV